MSATKYAQRMTLSKQVKSQIVFNFTDDDQLVIEILQHGKDQTMQEKKSNAS